MELRDKKNGKFIDSKDIGNKPIKFINRNKPKEKENEIEENVKEEIKSNLIEKNDFLEKNPETLINVKNKPKFINKNKEIKEKIFENSSIEYTNDLQNNISFKESVPKIEVKEKIFQKFMPSTEKFSKENEKFKLNNKKMQYDERINEKNKEKTDIDNISWRNNKKTENKINVDESDKDFNNDDDLIDDSNSEENNDWNMLKNQVQINDLKIDSYQEQTTILSHKYPLSNESESNKLTSLKNIVKNKKNSEKISIIIQDLVDIAKSNEEETVDIYEDLFKNKFFIEMIEVELSKGESVLKAFEMSNMIIFIINMKFIIDFTLKHTFSKIQTIQSFPMKALMDCLDLLELQENDSIKLDTIKVLKNDFNECKKIIEEIKINKLKQGKNCRENEENKNSSFIFKKSIPVNYTINYNYEEILEIDQLLRPKIQFFPHIIGDKYDSWEQYLNNMFHLLKEDFISGLSTALIALKKSGINDIPKEIFDSTYLYMKGKIMDEIYVKNGIFLYLRMSPYLLKKNHKINWTTTKRLIYGTLIVLTNPDLKEFVLAVVCSRVNNDKKQINKQKTDIDLIIKGIGNENLNVLEICSKLDINNLVVLESKAYFESYYHFLKALQNINHHSMPFTNQIIFNISLKDKAPSYLKDFQFIINKNSLKQMKSNICLDFHNPPVKNDLEALLDESQFQALRNILTNEFSIIQGPPGTGKSFIGALAVKILLENKFKWRNETESSPILVVAYTNHALDQFLCHLLEFTQKIVRVGGRCIEEKLKNYMLVNLRKNLGKMPNGKYFKCLYEKSENLREKLSVEKLEIFNKSKLDFTTFITSFPMNYQIKFKNDLKNYFLRYKIEFEKEFHWKTLEDLFIFWRENSNMTEEFYQKIKNNEKIWNLNKIKGFDKFGFSKVEKMEIVNENNEDDESIYSDETEDQYYVENKKLENDFYDINYDLITNENGKLYFSYISEEDRENLEYFNFFSKRNIWDLNTSERDILTKYSFYQIQKKGFSSYQKHIKEYMLNKSEIEKILLDKDLMIFENCDIIGMTVSGCAKYSNYLEKIQSPITVIEEAAEVLECFNISVLTPHCKHLIMIGDHQQLRPHIESYNLEKNYNFAISLFERMVINGMNFVTLEKQRRMRTDFADFIRIIYGNKYKDHESVLNYEDIIGINSNLCFFNHPNEENLDQNSKTKTNEFEANFICLFTRYLILQGFQQNQISIISMYIGQTLKIRSILKEMNITKTYVASVDNYQGEENDIVIVSLVRSNKNGIIGFTSSDNRICVALSRARKGLYVFGNFDCLCNSKKSSNLWIKMVELAKSKTNCYVNSLNLSCQNHKKEAIVQTIKDFNKVPEGGCLEICNTRKPCGHICKKNCHNFPDQFHDQTKCSDNCDKILSCGHKCKKRCSDECECKENVLKNLLCGHSCFDLCPKPISMINCMKNCEKTRKCGHPCPGKCYQKCDETWCFEKVSKILLCDHYQGVQCSQEIESIKCESKCQTSLNCGHICEGNCYTCFNKNIHVPCNKPCEKILDCKHKCKKLCGEWCGFCLEKCQNSCFCKNLCNNKCGEPCNFNCEHLENHDFKKCEKILEKCGHKCSGLDGEICPSICLLCQSNLTNFGIPIIIELTCGHAFWMTDLDNYLQDLWEIKEIFACHQCSTPIKNVKRYETFELRKKNQIKKSNIENFIKKFENLALEKLEYEALKCEIQGLKKSQKKNNVLEFISKIFNIEQKFELVREYQNVLKFKKNYPALNSQGSKEIRLINNQIENLKNLYIDNIIDTNEIKWKEIRSKFDNLNYFINLLANKINENYVGEIIEKMVKTQIFLDKNCLDKFKAIINENYY